jgi:hypothetical protein
MKKPVQVYFVDEELERLQAWAAAREKSVAYVVRAAVNQLVQSDERDPLLAAAGLFEGGPRDGSQDHDRHLEEPALEKGRGRSTAVRRHRRVHRAPRPK